MIIGIVGQPASGKSTASAYLQQKYDFEVVKFSGFIRDILQRMFLEVTRENLSKLSTALRDTFGKDIFSRVVAKEVKNRDKVILEGVRVPEDLLEFEDKEDFFLLAIEAKQRTRYDRITDRSENADDQTKTYEEFLEDHQRETERHIEEIMKKADEKIDNNKDLDHLYTQLDQLIEKINGNQSKKN